MRRKGVVAYMQEMLNTIISIDSKTSTVGSSIVFESCCPHNHATIAALFPALGAERIVCVLAVASTGGTVTTEPCTHRPCESDLCTRATLGSLHVR